MREVRRTLADGAVCLLLGLAVPLASAHAQAAPLTVPGGATEEITLEPAIGGLPLFPVGDGRGVLALDSQSLVLDDVTLVGDLQVLAENCDFSRVGEPGWSVA